MVCLLGFSICQKNEFSGKGVPLLEKIRESQEHSNSTYGYRRVHILLEQQEISKKPKTVLRVLLAFLLSSFDCNIGFSLNGYGYRKI